MASISERRELRNRRILANSEERLNRIRNIQNQRQDNIVSKNNSVVDTSSLNSRLSADHNCAVSTSFDSHKIKKVEYSEDHTQTESRRINNATILESSSDDLIDSSSDVFPQFQDQSLHNQSNINNCKRKLLSLNHGVVILLAFFVHYLHIISEQYAYIINIDIFDTYLNNIFVPIFVYEITNCLMFRKYKKNTNFLIALLLGGRQSNELERIFIYFYHFQCIFQDVMIYFFSFISFDIIINYLTKGKEYILK